MAERLFFGSPPFRFFANHLVQDKEFLEDARRIISLSPDVFDQLATALESCNSFIDRELLNQKVEETLGTTEETNEITRIIWRMASMLRDADEPLNDTVLILKTTFSEKLTDLKQEERNLLIHRFERLTVSPLGFNKQHKAQQLAEATGRELSGIQIICDIRPVFSDDRMLIEGGIPVTTLHLTLSDIASESALEIRLNEEQLNELCDKTQAAIRKMTAIKTMLGEKEIAMPRTSATKN